MRPQILGIDFLLGGGCDSIANLLRRDTLSQPQQRLIGLGREVLAEADQILDLADGPDRRKQDGRDSEGQDQVIGVGCEEPRFLRLFRGYRRGCGNMIQTDDLNRPRGGVDFKDPVLGPGHRLVVVIDPDKDMHVALLGVQHDRPILLIDADGAYLVVLDIVDFLVVDSCRSWIRKKLRR